MFIVLPDGKPNADVGANAAAALRAIDLAILRGGPLWAAKARNVNLAATRALATARGGTKPTPTTSSKPQGVVSTSQPTGQDVTASVLSSKLVNRDAQKTPTAADAHGAVSKRRRIDTAPSADSDACQHALWIKGEK